jgi:S-adenosylmethionine:tRNA ribosyltransferase-isomerase
MKTADLDFTYPEELIATSPHKVSRVMWVDSARDGGPEETTISQLISRIRPEDVVVVNETKVIKARVICRSGLEILFIKNLEKNLWEVLCPARRWSAKGETLPDGTAVTLVKTGLPQVVETAKPLSPAYFDQYGDIPLPPYIQEKRGERASRDADEKDYQTAWARVTGSLAAPTASLHFKAHDIDKIKARGVEVVPLTLHVGLGTFLPVHAESLDEHKMHSEWVQISNESLAKIKAARESGGRVWALGTTVLRALESQAVGYLSETRSGFEGFTDLFIRPGHDFKVVDVLMTNFHQPQSTLLALVGAFASLDKVLSCYQWAIEREFRLFSYGDLTVWIRR